MLRESMQMLHALRMGKRYQEADLVRCKILSMDPGFRIKLTADRAVLEHWPVPLFSDDVHKGLNFGLFVTDGR